MKRRDEMGKILKGTCGWTIRMGRPMYRFHTHLGSKKRNM